ncbi:SMC-Scp complex subunit ScpB [Candidatus Poribacteria bacterium]|nr:SMC-Scp complex subunit ScpB [Candidatus Poribacteria bacterium]
MQQSEAKSVIEAVIFAADRPVTAGQLVSIMVDMDNESIIQLINELKQDYDREGRSFQIVEIANGYQIRTRDKYAPWIKSFYTTEISSRLSISALEALAIIAYRQPATRAEVEEIRGVNSDSVLRTLQERNLIEVIGRKQAPGKPMIYGTTEDFLMHFGLKDLSELPSIDEIERMLGTPKEEMRSEIREILG